jgi:hypothetical protein
MQALAQKGERIMGSKGMTISQTQMYEGMIKDEFNSLITILKARSDAVEPMIRVRVKKELGVYTLLLKKAALEEELKSIGEQIHEKTKSIGEYESGRYVYHSKVEDAVAREIRQYNEPLREAEAYRDALIKELRLSLCPADVKEVFVRLEPEIKKRLEEAKSLPPLEWKPTKEDRKLLSLEGIIIE